ncbi:MAG: hypothetical protein AAF533_20690 [Acidobacteriota bacterium]
MTDDHGSRPLIVLLTGEPGSGKRTLGTELSLAMRLPFVSRDDMRGGLYFSVGAWTDSPGTIPSADQAVETFLRIVETHAELGVSCLAEYIARSHRPEDLRRLDAAGRLVVIETWCSNPEERVIRRNHEDRLVNRRPVLDALGYATNEDHTSALVDRMRAVTKEMQTEFDVPSLRVNCDDGHEPTLDAIIDWIAGQAS